LSTLSHRTSFALLVNPTHPALAEPVVRGVQAEARTLGIELHLPHASSDSDLDAASSDSDLDAAFATAARLQAAGRRCAPLMPSGPQIRDKKLPYILKLFVAEQLTIYGLAYLTELHEGRDPRFTGC
jgi:hypothetical protein